MQRTLFVVSDPYKTGSYTVIVFNYFMFLYRRNKCFN